MEHSPKRARTCARVHGPSVVIILGKTCGKRGAVEYNVYRLPNRGSRGRSSHFVEQHDARLRVVVAVGARENAFRFHFPSEDKATIARDRSTHRANHTLPSQHSRVTLLSPSSSSTRAIRHRWILVVSTNDEMLRRAKHELWSRASNTRSRMSASETAADHAARALHRTLSGVGVTTNDS